MRKRLAQLSGGVMLLTLWTMPQSANSNLELKLMIEKGEFAPNEPVPVQYMLRNRSAVAQPYPGDVGPNSDWIKFEVGSGALHPYRTGGVACRFIQNRTLAPGEALRAQVLMISNQHSRGRGIGQTALIRFMPFSTAGNYEIKARYPLGSDDPNEALNSNVLQVVVRKANEKERSALAFFDSPDALSLALGGESSGATPSQARSLEASVESWERFVEAFGDTAYGPYVRLNLARTYVLDQGLKTKRPDLAATHLRAVIASGPKAIVDDALLDLAKVDIAEGQTTEAQDATARLLKDFPDSEFVPEARRISEGLKAGRHTMQDILSN